jgi:hypothetical protein
MLTSRTLTTNPCNTHPDNLTDLTYREQKRVVYGEACSLANISEVHGK